MRYERDHLTSSGRPRRTPGLRHLLHIAGGAQIVIAAGLVWLAPTVGTTATLVLGSAWIATVACLGMILRTACDPLDELGAMAVRVRSGELHGIVEVDGVPELHELSAMLSDLLVQLRVLRERHQTQVALEANITRIAELVRQPRSIDAVLERTVRELAAALPATEVIITLVEGFGDCSHAVWDTSGDVHIIHHADENALDEAQLIRAAIVHGDVIAVSNVAEYDFGDPAVGASLLRRDVHAVLITPVYSGNTPLGALVVNAGRPGTWPDASLRLVRAIARELAAAVQYTGAQRREQEMLSRLTALDRVQRDFVTSVSDELRSPLQAIAASLERLDADTGTRLDAEQRRVLRVVRIHSERLSAVLDGLLTLSRVESRAATATFSVVPTSPLIEGLRRYATNIRGDRHLALNFAEPPTSLAVLGDQAQVHRALANVIDNAVKFTPDGGEVTLAVRASKTMVSFTVTDTGIGMSEHERPRPLMRWLRPRTPGTASGGIGLEIVRSVLEHHGGSLDIDSVPGAGTSVTLSFPRAGTSIRPTETAS